MVMEVRSLSPTPSSPKRPQCAVTDGVSDKQSTSFPLKVYHNTNILIFKVDVWECARIASFLKDVPLTLK